VSLEEPDFLAVEDLLEIAAGVLDEVAIRDAGLLAAAAARPRTTLFGKDAYPAFEDKAAALLHSLVRNHALVDGNKRLGLAAVIAFYGVNGRRLTLTNDEAYELVMSAATGDIDDVTVIAQRLESGPR
jgi:death on curing protein